jgi:hypothetical protein
VLADSVLADSMLDDSGLRCRRVPTEFPLATENMIKQAENSG